MSELRVESWRMPAARLGRDSPLPLLAPLLSATAGEEVDDSVLAERPSVFRLRSECRLASPPGPGRLRPHSAGSLLLGGRSGKRRAACDVSAGSGRTSLVFDA